MAGYYSTTRPPTKGDINDVFLYVYVRLAFASAWSVDCNQCIMKATSVNFQVNLLVPLPFLLFLFLVPVRLALKILVSQHWHLLVPTLGGLWGAAQCYI